MTIQSKVIVISVIILFGAMGGSTLVTTTYFADEYLSARKSEAFVIAQTLKSQLDRLIQMHIPVSDLVGFDKMCRVAVSEHPAITYAMVVDLEGTILFHNDPSQHGRKIRADSVLDAMGQSQKWMQETLIGDGKFYDIFLPVSEDGEEVTAFIRIGFPVDHIAQKTRKLALYSAGVALLSFVIGCSLMIVMLKRWVGTPIAQLTATIRGIKENGFIDTDRQVAVSSSDEVGHLATAFNAMTAELQRTTVRKAHVDLILEHMLNSLVITDGEGVIQFVNQETLNILGYQREELMGEPFGKILDPSEDMLGGPVSDPSGSVKAMECFYRSKAGEAVPILFSSSLLPLKKGDTQGRICVAQDMTETKMLRGLIPICTSCKKIRDDKGYWSQVEAYISRHSQAKFSHGICPECVSKIYPDWQPDESA